MASPKMGLRTPLLPRNSSDHEAMRRRPTRKRISRFQAAALAILIGLFWLARTWQCSDPNHHHEWDDAAKVPLEIHMMSKCPDARDCLKKLIIPTMANVSDKVDFKLSFIGTTTDEDDGVQCMHGQTECLGNILELCAASEYPDPKIYLGFTMCLSNDYKDIPSRDLISACSLEHGIDFGTLNNCMSRDDGAYGMGMLRESVKRSADLNVTTSCTVRLDGKKRCVVDGGKFRDCEGGSEPADLVKDINQLYDEAKGWSE